jgi:hypothetical protein
VRMASELRAKSDEDVSMLEWSGMLIPIA